MVKNKISKEKKENKKEDKGWPLISAGLLIGMGFGFIYGNVSGGLFIGLGTGMAVWAIISLIRK